MRNTLSYEDVSAESGVGPEDIPLRLSIADLISLGGRTMIMLASECIVE